MKNLLFVILAIVVSGSAIAQAPVMTWQRSLGGSNDETAYQVQPTSDGGYIIAGKSNSTNGDVTGNHGVSDFWVVKINPMGLLQWQKSLGGSGDDEASSVQQTTDGGYIVAGYTNSTNGNVTGNHGGYDFWVVKLNDTGGIQWQKALGGSADDMAYSVMQTHDGGYIVAGNTSSNDSEVTGNHGNSDYWVVKLSSTGTMMWQKSLGGFYNEVAKSVREVAGGYIVAGYTLSGDGQVTGIHGLADYWIVKLDDTGALTWQKALGGSNTDIAESIRPTYGGGYIVAGWSRSNDGNVTGNNGYDDYWIVKLNDTGGIQWQRNLGGSLGDMAKSVEQTVDSGYIVAGTSFSGDGDLTVNHGSEDFWLLKLSPSGSVQWQKSLGGTGSETSFSAIATSDGGYVVAGAAGIASGDVLLNHGAGDVWIVKLNCGISAGVIYGPPSVCFGNTIILTDTTHGGVWHASNTHALVSAGIVAGISAGIDTILYTVSNSCGSAVAWFPVIVTVCPTSASQPEVSAYMTIAPNPATGNVFVKCPSPVDIDLWNMTGKLVARVRNDDHIFVGDLPTGVYLIRIYDSDGKLLRQERIYKE